jgi:multicomponent K+:H+ antiporter subunit D
MGFLACAAVIAGVPPMSGFLAKVAMLDGALSPGAGEPVASAAWWFTGLLIGTGLLSTVALARAGIRYIWAPRDRPAPSLRVIEVMPIAGLLVVALGLVVGAGPTLQYVNATAQGLLAPQPYLDAILSATPRPGPARLRTTQAAQAAQPALPAQAGVAR